MLNMNLQLFGGRGAAANRNSGTESTISELTTEELVEKYKNLTSARDIARETALDTFRPDVVENVNKLSAQLKEIEAELNKRNNTGNDEANSVQSTFNFRELPTGKSNEDKRLRATRLTQDYYAIAERGTYKDLVELNSRIISLNNDNMLFKSDEKRITSARVYAERGIKARKAWE